MLVVVGGMRLVFSNRLADIVKNIEYCRASSNTVLCNNHSIDQRDHVTAPSGRGHNSYQQDIDMSEADGLSMDVRPDCQFAPLLMRTREQRSSVTRSEGEK